MEPPEAPPAIPSIPGYINGNQSYITSILLGQGLGCPRTVSPLSVNLSIPKVLEAEAGRWAGSQLNVIGC